MLKATQKISSREFTQFYRKGKKINTEHFRVSLVNTSKKENPKFAVVVSKKVAKTAVLRNKNKRRIYEILRQLYPQFSGVKYGFFFIQKDISRVDFYKLKSEIEEIITFL